MHQHTGTFQLEELVSFRVRYVSYVNRPGECMCYKLVIPATENNHSMSSNKLQGHSGKKNSTSNSSWRSDERIMAALDRVTKKNNKFYLRQYCNIWRDNVSLYVW